MDSAIQKTKGETVNHAQKREEGPPALRQGPKETIQLGKTAIVEKAKPACTNKLISRLNSCL